MCNSEKRGSLVVFSVWVLCLFRDSISATCAMRGPPGVFILLMSFCRYMCTYTSLLCGLTAVATVVVVVSSSCHFRLRVFFVASVQCSPHVCSGPCRLCVRCAPWVLWGLKPAMSLSRSFFFCTSDGRRFLDFPSPHFQNRLPPLHLSSRPFTSLCLTPTHVSTHKKCACR